jgi:uncharacterized protein YbbC (DUF1343 family)
VIRFGLDALVQRDFDLLKGHRVGLLTHPAAITGPTSPAPRSAFEIFRSSKQVQLVAVFGPEHGFTGEAQDLIPVESGQSQQLRVHSLYGDSFESLKPTAEMLKGFDFFVIDLQDIGSRYYTFQATMLYCMEACASLGIPVVVLDRPNPIAILGIEGPGLKAGFESFVGPHDLCTCHSLTMGELARFYRAERVPQVDLTVIRLEGWNRTDEPNQWANRWVPPSPNMPALSTAMVYPGMCLIEGTNLSEGRGTTRPFEYVGHPNINGDELAEVLRSWNVPNLEVLPARFTPTFQKHMGRSCGGVFLLPYYGPGFKPVRAGLAILCAFRQVLGEAFQWRTSTYEFVSDIPAIDLLFGSSRERLAIEQGKNWNEISEEWNKEETAFAQRIKPYLLYRS